MRVLTNLSNRWRLTEDGIQWRLEVAKPHTKRGWVGVSFIATKRIDILLRCINDKANVGERLGLMQSALWWHQLTKG